MNRITFSLSLATLLIVVVGCSTSGAEGPPEIRYGQTECAHCGMIVSQERFASAIRASIDGQDQELIYDDLRCMVLNDRLQKLPPQSRRYVHDADTSAWLKAEEARFIRDPETHTPMGSGLLAFAPTSPRATGGVGYEQIETLLKKSTSTTRGAADIE